LTEVQSPFDRMDNPIVLAMCLTSRHDFGLERDPADIYSLTCGMTPDQRKALYRDMYQLWEFHFKPHSDKMEKELDQLVDENTKLREDNEKLLRELRDERDKVSRYQNNGNFY
jgi:hypothetical protein